jgi:hypothetical protein
MDKEESSPIESLQIKRDRRPAAATPSIFWRKPNNSGNDVHSFCGKSPPFLCSTKISGKETQFEGGLGYASLINFLRLAKA